LAGATGITSGRRRVANELGNIHRTVGDGRAVEQEQETITSFLIVVGENHPGVGLTAVPAVDSGRLEPLIILCLGDKFSASLASVIIALKLNIQVNRTTYLY